MFYAKGLDKEATRVLSNILELNLENPELLKVAAKQFSHVGEVEMAIKIYIEIIDLRPEEPQSHRDLALACIENKEYQKVADLFVFILDKKWTRFENIKDVVFN